MRSAGVPGTKSSFLLSVIRYMAVCFLFMISRYTIVALQYQSDSHSITLAITGTRRSTHDYRKAKEGTS